MSFKRLVSLSTIQFSEFQSWVGKKVTKFPVGLSLPMAWIFLGIISLPLYFAMLKQGFSQAYGDLLFLDSLFIDLFEHGGRWASWSMTPAPAYVPDMLLYLPAYFFLSHTMDRIFFVSLCHAFMVAGTAIFLIRSLTSGRRTNISILAIGITCLVSYCAYTSMMWMYFNATNSHVGGYLLALMALAMFIRSVHSPKTRYLLALVALVIIGRISGKTLFVIWFVVPALATSISSLYGLALTHSSNLFRIDSIKPVFRGAAATVVGLLLGSLIEPFITTWDSLELLGRTGHPISFEKTLESTEIMLRASREILMSGRTSFYILIAIWTLGIIFCLHYFAKHTLGSMISSSKNVIPSPLSPFSIYLQFTFWSLLLSPLAVLLSGQFRDILDFRYHMVPMALPIIAFLVILSRKANAMIEHKMVSAFLQLSMTAYSIWFLNHFEAFKSRKLTIAQVRGHVGTWELDLAQCLDQNQARYGLKFGVSDFWASRSSTLLSKTGIRVYAVDDGRLHPRHYMSNIDWFLGQGDHKFNNPKYNFVINSHSVHASNVIASAGLPQQYFSCPHGVVIFVYDDSSRFDALIKQKSRAMIAEHQFHRGTTDHLILDGDSLFTIVGEKKGPSYQGKPGSQRPGVLSYGPALKLPQGEYEFSIFFAASGAKLGEAVGRWDIYNFPSKIFASGDLLLSSKEDSILNGQFRISASDTEDHIEVRTHFDGIHSLNVNKVVLRRITDKRSISSVP